MEKRKPPIIDFHIHMMNHNPLAYAMMDIMADKLASEKEFEDYVAFYSQPENFVDYLKENGVDYGVILAEYIPLSYGDITNETVGEFCAGHKELIPFCAFNPYMHSQPGKELKRICREYDFRGIKLLPTYCHFYPHDQKLYPLYSVAEEMQIPVMFHTGSSVIANNRIKYGNPIFFDDIALDFPDLSIVMSHGGRGPWYAEALTMIRLHKNVYIDATGLPVRKLSEFYPDFERFAHKFIFGSDWPQIRMEDNIARFHQLGLAEESVNKILGENAAKLLKISW